MRIRNFYKYYVYVHKPIVLKNEDLSNFGITEHKRGLSSGDICISGVDQPID